MSTMTNTPTLPQSEDQIRAVEREKYARIAQSGADGDTTSCCGDCGCSTDFVDFSEDYTKLDGYAPDADLGLGCGLPTEFALIRPGDTVVDLGSGAGNDCFVARSEAGADGRVIGIDMTPEMIGKARTNAATLGYGNVEFRLGEIENIPMKGNTADVVVSNCVLNLVPVKERAFAEMFRILKPGGHFSVSDVVLEGNLPEAVQQASELYAGCVSGAMQQADYLGGLKAAGFANLRLQKRRAITVPDSVLLQYISAEELAEYKASGAGIFSITVYGEKPQAAACCDANGCC